ncbi:MAG: glycosyltransferase family 2 protein [Pirellulaceae bacterium]|nr:glycosyltransferase family 2 protein [Pirellulaceae bacterium]
MRNAETMDGDCTPSTSILLPVYNDEKYLRDAVESLLNQTFTNFELIAIDDGSNDCCPQILETFAAKDKRVRIISRPNTGYLRALQDGLQIARGDIIARMDADDVAHPERLEKQLAYLDSNPACVAVGSWVNFVEETGMKLFEWHPPTDHEQIDRELLAGRGAMIVHPTLTMRRSAFNEIGGYRNEFEYAEDFDLLLRLGEVGLLANIGEILLDYRQRPGSVCGKHAYKQQVLIKRALEQAYVRRELSRDTLPSLPTPKVISHHRYYVNLALGAIVKENQYAAQRCILRAIGAAPWDWLPWCLLAFTGPVWLSRCFRYCFRTASLVASAVRPGAKFEQEAVDYRA